jgi:hypothetical protein
VPPEGSLFSAWESFYVIVGSSAGALTGLQFVVITLIADVGPKGGVREVGAFGTPTVVHFCAALFVSAILSAPWQRLISAGVMLAVFEDWLFHVILPLVVYSIFLFAALILPGAPGPALFAIAGAVLTLLFIGIHNAWDTVTYVAFMRDEERRSAEEQPPSR